MDLRVAAPVGGSVGETCRAHRRHRPTPTYVELHHVIPQAWQQCWQPSKPWPLGGRSPSGTLLWDARTVPICRTGHGNLHFWLVAVMREIAVAPSTEQDVVSWAVRRVRKSAHQQGLVLGPTELKIALDGIGRFTAAGGRLSELISRGLWGQI